MKNKNLMTYFNIILYKTLNSNQVDIQVDLFMFSGDNWWIIPMYEHLYRQYYDRTFYSRHHNLVNRYGISVSKIITDIFILP